MWYASPVQSHYIQKLLDHQITRALQNKYLYLDYNYENNLTSHNHELLHKFLLLDSLHAQAPSLENINKL